MYPSNPTESRPEPWNKRKLIGQKPPLQLKEIWAIRIRLQLAHRLRDLAPFNLAIDSKLCACDLVRLRARDVDHGGSSSRNPLTRGGIAMPAYAIGLYDVWDWSWHKQYREPVTKLIEKYGGRYIARSSICPWEMLEGDPPQDASSFTLIEFPSMEQARAWHADLDYQPYIALRQKGSTLKLILVDGCDG